MAKLIRRSMALTLAVLLVLVQLVTPVIAVTSESVNGVDVEVTISDITDPATGEVIGTTTDGTAGPTTDGNTTSEASYHEQTTESSAEGTWNVNGQQADGTITETKTEGSESSTVTTETTETVADGVLVPAGETPEDLGQGEMTSETTEGPGETMGEAIIGGDEDYKEAPAEDDAGWTDTGEAQTSGPSTSNTTDPTVTIVVIPEGQATDSEGNTVTDGSELEFETPEQIVTTIKDGEVIDSDTIEYHGKEPKRNQEFIGLELGGKIYVADAGNQNDAYWLANVTYNFEGVEVKDGNVTVTTTTNGSGGMWPGRPGGGSSSSSRTTVITKETFESMGVQGTVTGITVSPASVNSHIDMYDSLVLRVQTLTSVLPGGEVITYDIKDGAAVVREHTIPVTEEMVIPEEYRDTSKYTITETENGWKVTTKNPITDTTTEYTEAENTSSYTATWLVKEDNAELDAQLADVEPVMDTSEFSRTTTKTTVSEDGKTETTIVRTEVKAQKVNDQGLELYLDENGNETTVDTGTRAYIWEPSYAVTTMVKGEVVATPAADTTELTAEQMADLKALYPDKKTVVAENPVLPASIPAPVNGIIDPVTNADGSTTTYAGYDQIMTNVNGRKYSVITVETKDADGNIIAQETLTVYGDLVTTNTTYAVDAEQRVIEYSQTYTETVENTWDGTYYGYGSRTWEREATTTETTTEEIIEFTKAEGSPDSFMFRGTTYAVQDENEADGNRVDYSHLSTTSIALNGKAADTTSGTTTVENYDTNISVEIKNGLFGTDSIAIVKDAGGNIIGKYRLADNSDESTSIGDFLTGRTVATPNNADGTTTYTLTNMILPNGAAFNIELCNPKNGTVVMNLGNTADVAANFDAELSVKMDYLVIAPEYNMTRTSSTTTSSSTQAQSLTKTFSSEQDISYKMTTTRIYENSASSLQIEGTVTQTTETTTEYDKEWEQIERSFEPKKDEGGGNDPVPLVIIYDDEPDIEIKEYVNDDGLVTIEDEEVPLAAAPSTGDATFVWGAMGLMSLGGSAFLGKKKVKKEEEA